MTTEQFNHFAPRIISEDETRLSLTTAFRHRGHLIACDGRFALVVQLDNQRITPSIEGQIRVGDSLLDDILPKLETAVQSGTYQPVPLGPTYSASCAAMGDLYWDMPELTAPNEREEDEPEPDPPDTERDVFTSYACVVFGPARAIFAAYYIYLLCRIMRECGQGVVYADPCNPHTTLYAKFDNVRIAIQPRLVELKSQSPWDFPYSGTSFADCATGQLVRARQFGTFCIHALRFPPRPSPLMQSHVSAFHPVIEHATCAIKPESGVN